MQLSPDQQRIAEALARIDAARGLLTEALCRLGFSEGKEAVQHAYLGASSAGRAVAQLNAALLASAVADLRRAA
jgi:hypothetical protein